MITIDRSVAEEVVSFIRHRPTIPKDVEDVIVEKQKDFYIKKLTGKVIKRENISSLRKALENCYLKSLVQPETVGIICGQCIGERTTQSSLNNFHSAGLDTGTTSQIDNLQTIINASKIKKNEQRKLFKVSLFMKDTFTSLQKLKEKTCHYLEEVTFNNLISSIRYKDVVFPGIKSSKVVVFSLKLDKIFFYRISRKLILASLAQHSNENYCTTYSSLNKEDTEIDVFSSYENYDSVFDLIRLVKNTMLVGIPGVKSHVFFQNQNKEWYIDCLSNSLSVFFNYGHIYNINRIICNSMNDVYQNFGILVTYEMILLKCKEIIPEIDTAHFKILAMRMTRNGFVEPLTRYTMRSNKSPLTKASFEESFEIFLKAAKYNEKEKFKTISSSIICGKKPKVGTYKCDILIDPKFYGM